MLRWAIVDTGDRGLECRMNVWRCDQVMVAIGKERSASCSSIKEGRREQRSEDEVQLAREGDRAVTEVRKSQVET